MPHMPRKKKNQNLRRRIRKRLEKQRPFPLFILPPACLERVFEFTQPLSRLACKLSCKRFLEIISKRPKDDWNSPTYKRSGICQDCGRFNLLNKIPACPASVCSWSGSRCCSKLVCFDRCKFPCRNCNRLIVIELNDVSPDGCDYDRLEEGYVSFKVFKRCCDNPKFSHLPQWNGVPPNRWRNTYGE
jgi:hypothetical protein